MEVALIFLAVTFTLFYIIGGITFVYHHCSPYELLIKIVNFIPNKLKSLTMINTKVLLKAMGFMLLPSLTILGIILLSLFSWTAFINFMTSQDGWSIFVRLLMILIEILFLCFMYNYYLKEEIKKKGKESATDLIRTTTGYSDIGDVIHGWDRSTHVAVYKTENPNVFVFEKINSK